MEPNQSQAGSQFDRSLARIAVGGYDDAQSMRKSAMNRIRDLVRKRNEGIPLDEVEDEKDDDDYDSKYKDENLPEIIEEMVEKGRLDQREYEYLQTMLEAANIAAEVEDHYSDVFTITTTEPVWEDWLQYVTGVGPTTTARLLHRFGYCEESPKPSNLWSYAGLAPGQEPERGEQLGYDPQAKKLGWQIATNMVRQGERSRYRTEFYDPYKEKQMTRMERADEGICIKCGRRDLIRDDGSSISFQTLPGATGMAEVKDHGDDGDPLVETDSGKIVILPDSEAAIGDEIAVKITADLDDYALGTVIDAEGVSGPIAERTEHTSASGDVCQQCYVRLTQNGEGIPSAPNSKAHADLRARRYLGKKFLKHYWAIARDIQGLETPDEWIITHGGHDKKVDSFENPFYAKRELKG